MLSRFDNTELDRISIQEIENLLDSSKETVFVTNKYVSERFALSDRDLDTPIVFRNCTFQHYIEISKSNIKGLTFFYCQFENSFMISHSACDINKSIHFSNCNFKDQIALRRLDLTTDLSFDKCRFNQRLTIDHIRIKKGNIKIAHSSLEEQVKITHVLVDSLEINTNIVKRDIDVRYTQAFIIALSDNEINGKVSLWRNFTAILRLLNGKFENEVYLLSNKVKSLLEFDNGKFDSVVNIACNVFEEEDFAINDLKIKDCDFKNGFQVVKDNSIPDQHTVIHSIEIICSPKLSGKLLFQFIDVCVITISDFNLNSDLLFDNILVNTLFINNFINKGNLIFSNFNKSKFEWYLSTDSDKEKFKIIKTWSPVNSLKVALDEDVTLNEANLGNTVSKIVNIFCVTSSNLGKTQFYNADLSNFESVLISNSIITEISTSNVKWFLNEKLGSINISQVERKLKTFSKQHRMAHPEYVAIYNEFLRKKELYRQLKLVMERNADRPQALIFQKLEMAYYRKALNSSNEGPWHDRLILWLSQTNDFGQNWWKATWIAAFVAFLIYTPIVLLISPILQPKLAKSWSDIVLSAKVIFQNLDVYLQLLNPAHNLKDIVSNKQELTTLVYLFDVFFRIVITFFIFQIVSAFRKYIKN